MKKLITLFFAFVLVTAMCTVSVGAMHWSEDECSIDSGGNYHPAHAWGYVFNIDSVDCMEGATTALFTTEEAYLNGIGNAKWKAHVLLAPTGEEYVYEVVAAFEYIGCSGQDAINNQMFDFEGGKYILVASDSGTRPDTNSDGSLVYPNWEDRAACWGLVNTIGAKVTLTDYDLSLGLMPEDVFTVTVENDPNKPDVSVDESKEENTEAPVESNGESNDANSESATTESTDENNAPIESTVFEKVFQVLFIVIMTVGIVGLPLYFWLNSKKKNALQEYNENNDNEDENE